MKLVKIIIILFVFTSCKKTYFQDDRLFYYAENVQAQLAQRGVSIELDVNLILQEGVQESFKAYGVSKGEDIMIDSENFEWAEKAGYYARIEALIAHEIGHNLLDLRHFEKSNRHLYDGKPIIMIPGQWQSINDDDLDEMYDVLALLYQGS